MKIKKTFNKITATVDNSTAYNSARPITTQELALLNNNPKFLEALDKARKADPELQGKETAITSIYRRNTHAARHAERESRKVSSLIGLNGQHLTY